MLLRFWIYVIEKYFFLVNIEDIDLLILLAYLFVDSPHSK